MKKLLLLALLCATAGLSAATYKLKGPSGNYSGMYTDLVGAKWAVCAKTTPASWAVWRTDTATHTREFKGENC